MFQVQSNLNGNITCRGSAYKLQRAADLGWRKGGPESLLRLLRTESRGRNNQVTDYGTSEDGHDYYLRHQPGISQKDQHQPVVVFTVSDNPQLGKQVSMAGPFYLDGHDYPGKIVKYSTMPFVSENHNITDQVNVRVTDIPIHDAPGSETIATLNIMDASYFPVADAQGKPLPKRQTDFSVRDIKPVVTIEDNNRPGSVHIPKPSLDELEAIQAATKNPFISAKIIYKPHTDDNDADDRPTPEIGPDTPLADEIEEFLRSRIPGPRQTTDVLATV